MSILLAKIKGRNGEVCKVLSQGSNLFDLPDLSDTHIYNPRQKLEDEEWFLLKDFSTLGFANELVGQAFNSTDYNQLTKAQFSNVVYFCAKQGHLLLFQKVNPSQLYARKWMKVSESPTISKEPMLVLNNFLDAIYDTETDELYFKDIARVKPIFKGIGELYRTASHTEVQTFLDNDMVALQNGYSANNVTIPNRKRIALAMDALDNFSKTDRGSITTYIENYCPDLKKNGDSFEISSETELKMLLFGIEQRFYTTEIGSKKRCANSVIEMG